MITSTKKNAGTVRPAETMLKELEVFFFRQQLFQDVVLVI